jgi:hypothetical protein
MGNKFGGSLFSMKELEDDVEEKVAEMDDKRFDRNFAIDAQIRRAMKEAIRNCDKSRVIIAAEITELVGVNISEHQLNAWTAASKNDYKMPIAYAAAFCEVTGDIRLVGILAQALGVKVVESRDILWLKYAQVREYEKRLKMKKRFLERKLKEEK